MGDGWRRAQDAARATQGRNRDGVAVDDDSRARLNDAEMAHALDAARYCIDNGGAVAYGSVSRALLDRDADLRTLVMWAHPAIVDSDLHTTVPADVAAILARVKP